MTTTYPILNSVVLDTTDARGLAEFYRELLGYSYRLGDEPPAEGEPDPRGDDWLVLIGHGGALRIAFQQVAELTPSTWPSDEVPQQMHLDLLVQTEEELLAQHERVLALGGRVIVEADEEPLSVYADPAGHPFCVFVGG
ncbi:MAG: VOC family protein [Aeromicrobium sp.]|uniref:VOC family protein n=1 Tax=Aeromicrobium sp. TaxID=1871063 RepID=UPI0039E50A73